MTVSSFWNLILHININFVFGKCQIQCLRLYACLTPSTILNQFYLQFVWDVSLWVPSFIPLCLWSFTSTSIFHRIAYPSYVGKTFSLIHTASIFHCLRVWSYICCSWGQKKNFLNLEFIYKFMQWFINY